MGHDLLFLVTVRIDFTVALWIDRMRCDEDEFFSIILQGAVSQTR